MEKFIDFWARTVIRFRWLIVVLLPLLLFMASAPSGNIRFEHSAEMWFAKDDPVHQQYQELKDRFGETEVVLVGVEIPKGAESVFAPASIEAVARIQDFLKRHKLVTSVTSLINYQYIRSADDVVDIKSLIDDAEAVAKRFADPAERAQITSIIGKENLALDLLVTRDLRHTVIVAEMMRRSGKGVDDEVRLIKDLKAFLDIEDYASKGVTVHVFGRPYITHEITTGNVKDQMLFYPLMMAMTLLLLLLVFKRLSGMLMPWVVIVGAVMMAFSFQGLMSWPTSVASASLPILVVVFGIALAVHVMWEFFRQRKRGCAPKQAAENSIREIWLPTFYSTLTGMLGFFGITLTRLEPIRQYGYVACVGVMVSFFLAQTLLPALLSFVKGIPKQMRSEDDSEGRLDGFLQHLGRFTIAHQKPILAVGFTMLIVGFAMTMMLSMDSNFVNLFRKHSEFRQEFAYFDKTYKGGQAIDFVIDSGKPDGAIEPGLLKRIAALEAYLGTLEQSGKPASVLDFIRKLNQSMHNDDQAYFSIPDSRELVSQLLLLYENGSADRRLANMLTDDRRFLRITIRTRNMSAVETNHFIQQIQNKLDTDFADLHVKVTGDLVLFNTMDYYIADGMAQSFMLDMGTVAAAVLILFLSVRMMGVVVLVSTLPIFTAGGVMYALGINPDLTTTIIGSITFGISVDDIMHFMMRYKRARKNGRDVDGSLLYAYREAGNGMVLSSLILVFGFAVFLFSSLMSGFYFGMLSLVVIGVGLVGDLMFLPALIRFLDSRERKDGRAVEVQAKEEIEEFLPEPAVDKA